MTKIAKVEGLPPVDLSILDQFAFVAGSGNYGGRQVCIMTGLHLCTEIAAGRITLEEALAGEVDVQDRVDCVSRVLNSLCISRNDSFSDLDNANVKRKDWAVALLPKLLGTKRSEEIEERAQILVQEVGDREYRKYNRELKAYVEKDISALVKESKELAQKYIDMGDGQYLRRAIDVLDLINGVEQNSDWFEDEKVQARHCAVLDAKIEAVIDFLHAN